MKDDALKQHVVDVLGKTIPDIEPWDYGSYKFVCHDIVYRLNIRRGDHVIHGQYGIEDKVPVLIVQVNRPDVFELPQAFDAKLTFFRFQTPLAHMKGLRKAALDLRKKLDKAPLFELVQA